MCQTLQLQLLQSIIKLATYLYSSGFTALPRLFQLYFFDVVAKMSDVVIYKAMPTHNLMAKIYPGKNPLTIHVSYSVHTYIMVCILMTGY